jgi:hypothetical protein
MPFAFVSLAQIMSFARMDSATNELLDRLGFATVRGVWLFWITRAWAWPFGPIYAIG